MVRVLGVAVLLSAKALAAADADSPRDTAGVVFDDSASISVDDGRELRLRVVYVPPKGPSPVIVLSHGTFSAGNRYDAVSGYWAEHGYVVVLPDHRDANYRETPTSEAQMLDIIDSRGRDLLAIADQLEKIAGQIPALRGRLDGSRLASAGHSVGTQPAMLMTGLKIRNPVDGSVKRIDDDRYRATILLSDPGKMALMPADVWLGGSRPTFLVTGPDDYGLMGDGRRPATYENEVQGPVPAVPGTRYLLSITGMDHQFGGLIHKKTEAPPDHEALAVFLELSTAFLDLYIRGTDSEKSELEPRKLSARATLTVE